MSFRHQAYIKIPTVQLMLLEYVILITKFYQNYNCSYDITLVLILYTILTPIWYRFDTIIAISTMISIWLLLLYYFNVT